LTRRPPRSSPDGAGRLRAGAAVTLVAFFAAGCASSPRLDAIATRAQLPAAVELTSTPFHPQTDQQCGPAAVATLLGAAGHDVSAAQLSHEVFLPGRDGSLQPELVGALRARGLLPYRLGPDLTELMAETAAGRPVLLLQKQGVGPWPAWHYAVAVGYDARRDVVLLRSGRHARLPLKAGVLDSTWARAERWAVVALEPGTLPTRPDLIRYMEAAAGLEATGQAARARLAYEAAAKHWPNEPLPRLGLANLAAARGDWREAERGYASVLDVAPDMTAAINNRAEALSRLGCTRAARRALEAGAARVAPDDPLRSALDRTLAAWAPEDDARSDPAYCSDFAEIR
jgi:hypothetical protein